MSVIKILSGWSDVGGSTTAFINLTNLFNENGYECIFYGPHNYHLTKCRSGNFQDLDLTNDDILICHFLPNITTRINVKKMILSLHEKHLFPLKERKHDFYDKIQYLNDGQRLWHGVDHPYFICPNAHTNLIKTEKTFKNIAGIIGSIDRNKQTHVSIKRAIDDKKEKIYLFGKITDELYYKEKVQPLLQNNTDKVVFMGFIEDRQLIYNMVSDVYMSSLSENQSFVADECFMTGTTFHGNDSVREITELKDNKYVLETWLKELEL